MTQLSEPMRYRILLNSKGTITGNMGTKTNVKPGALHAVCINYHDVPYVEIRSGQKRSPQ